MNNLLEKLEVYGEEKLTDEELLSIILWGENTKEKNLKIAKNLIRNNKDFTGDLRFLMQISINELQEQGLSLGESARIKALSGIFNRLFYPINPKLLELNSSEDVVKWFMSELRFEKTEFIKIVILNNKNKVLKISTLSKGTSNNASITPKEILSEPLKMKANKIILVHKHPSGDSKPSLKDIQTTRIIKKCADLMGIELLDHIIIGDGNWSSVIA